MNESQLPTQSSAAPLLCEIRVEAKKDVRIIDAYLSSQESEENK